MKKGIIFDLDGVILSTDEYHYLAWKKIADQEGIYFDKVINNRLRGVSRMDSLNIILERANKKYSEEEKIELANKKNGYYVEFLKLMDQNSVSKEVISTLKRLKELGIKLAIGSSSKNTKFILKQVGLIDMFDAISDGTNITKSKPDPEVFLKAAEFINLKPSDCYVVEDATTGIDAAKRGDFEAIGISDASKYAKTDIRINSLKEILNLFK